MKPRATKFIGTGNEIYTNTRIYSPLGWHIYFIIYPYIFIYTHIPKVYWASRFFKIKMPKVQKYIRFFAAD